MLVKLITIVLTLWIAIVAPALADWTPTFDPNTHVYIDPALANSPSAPVKFGSELELEMSKYKRTNYYVVALESSYQGTGKMGVDATDRVINSWSDLENFPSDKYAIVVWARSKFDTSKGGFGKNVSLDLQKISEGIDTKKLIKEHMPRNPKGVMLGIVNIYETALNVLLLIIIVACCLLSATLILLLDMSGLFDGIRYKMSIVQRSQDEIDKWDKASADLTNRLLKIAEQDVIGFYFKIYPDSVNLAQLNQTLYQLVRLSDLIFNTFFEAKVLHSNKEYQNVIDLLTQNVLSIDYDSEGGNFGGVRTINTNWILREVTATLDRIEQDIKILESNSGSEPSTKPSPQPEIIKPKPAPPKVDTSPEDYDYKSQKCNWTVDNSSKHSHTTTDINYWFNVSSGSDTVLRPSDPAPSSSSSSSDSSSSSSSWFSGGDDYSSSDSSSDGDDY